MQYPASLRMDSFYWHWYNIAFAKHSVLVTLLLIEASRALDITIYFAYASAPINFAEGPGALRRDPWQCLD